MAGFTGKDAKSITLAIILSETKIPILERSIDCHIDRKEDLLRGTGEEPKGNYLEMPCFLYIILAYPNDSPKDYPKQPDIASISRGIRRYHRQYQWNANRRYYRQIPSRIS